MGTNWVLTRLKVFLSVYCWAFLDLRFSCQDFFFYFWVLSKVSFLFDLLSPLILCLEAQSVSEIVEICMRKASLLPWYDPDICLSVGALCCLVQVIKNPRTENNSLPILLFPRSPSSACFLCFFWQFIILFLITQKSSNKDHKNIKKEVVVSVLADWSLQVGRFLLFTFLSM